MYIVQCTLYRDNQYMYSFLLSNFFRNILFEYFGRFLLVLKSGRKLKAAFKNKEKSGNNDSTLYCLLLYVINEKRVNNEP